MTDMYRIIQSDLFTFCIGPEKKPFVVHSKAIAETSPYFDRLVNGGLNEAQVRSAELEDVDPETFVRFLEYAYRRNYTTPSWTRDGVAPENGAPEIPSNHVNKFQDPISPIDDGFDPHPATEPATANASWGMSWTNSNAAPSAFGTMPSTKKSKKMSKAQVNSRTAFNKREYVHPVDNVTNRLDLRCEPVLNEASTENFTSVFLAHARLYTLADMRMVNPLKDLALHKLHKTLVGFELFPERLGDVVELARYAYEHGEDRSENGRIDALRDMVVNYIALEMKTLGKHADFRNLMDGGGEFAGDFWDIVSQELL